MPQSQLRYDGLTGLRFALFIPIYFLHVGYRECLAPTMFCLSLFFLLSGLVGGMSKSINFCQGSLLTHTKNYLWKKIKIFYPLYFLGFSAVAFLMIWNGGWDKIGSIQHALFLIATNLSFTQAWWPEPSIKFSFNGVSWFISALMFCFALTPILLRYASNLKTRYLYLIPLICILIKLIPFVFNPSAELSNDWTQLFNHNWHNWPPMRLLDYCIGLSFGLLLQRGALQHYIERVNGSKLLYPLELNCYVATLLSVYGATVIARPITLLGALFSIFFILCPCSIASRILSTRLFVVSGASIMTVFLTHNIILKYLNFAILKTHMHLEKHTIAIIGIILCIITAYLWQKLTDSQRKGTIN